MSELYDNPLYYEIAFSFRDIPSEVDLFEKCFQLFSRVPVKSVLELGCGNSPHMEELAKRGYRYYGLDLNPAMLTYSRSKAERAGIDVNLFQANMNDFVLDKNVDFVFLMLGSLFVKNNDELNAHLDSVAKVLNKGGLYLQDWCIQDEPMSEGQSDCWELERDGIKVKTTHSCRIISRTEQTFEEKLVIEVDDNGKQYKVTDKAVRRGIYPQEFLSLISNHPHFEFVGWWNNWDLNQPLDKAGAFSRPIVLLRRI